jgi:hypothetical protein
MLEIAEKKLWSGGLKICKMLINSILYYSLYIYIYIYIYIYVYIICISHGKL